MYVIFEKIYGKARLNLILIGFVISFLGSFPVGNINLTAFQISIHHSFLKSLEYALVVTSSELVFVFITIYYINKIDIKKSFFKVLFLTIVLLLLFMACNHIYAAFSNQPFDINESENKVLSPAVTALLLNILNPFQIPFWMSWNKILIEKNIFHSTFKHYAGYLLGISLGTFSCLMLYCSIGRMCISYVQEYRFLISFFTGLAYIFIGVFLIIKQKRLGFS
jgi:threonine/homoserine/homoserine lactone efflux protein